MSSKGNVAFITGGASGMGLATVERLISDGWKVAVFDFNAVTGAQVAERLGPNLLFLQGNVANYDDQAKAFLQTWSKWGRIDFVWANAGTGDRTQFFADAKETENGAPPAPDLLAIDVCLIGVFYSSYLALHYFKKNPDRKGKLIMTSSSTGIHAHYMFPAYSASKHGMRILGEKITVNCICPGLVPTAIISASYVATANQDAITPPSLIVDCVYKILGDDSLNGACLEVVGKEIIERPEPAPANWAAEYLLGDEFAAVTRKAGEIDKIYQGAEDKNEMSVR
ncbi:hypothetical protein AYO20_09927 [Fonsecaea nubica]|uniref:Uncharacterized protein n=1 Tax=Fonsecaea nubica TaxID=856822 RepID=A0A178CC20_9EURO|nr:hypothetical protein AYO20_09927 [Fonsecaea nubica]OAL26894.1 hypothetical protein AYO20_09927 [Fonsecaea nubica]